MTDEDLEHEAPDAFTTEGECWAWKKVPGVIGASNHTHVCRELTDNEGHHEPPHRCGCGAEF